MFIQLELKQEMSNLNQQPRKFFKLDSWKIKVTKTKNPNQIELENLISKTSMLDELNFINEQKIEEIMKEFNLSSNFSILKKKEELLTRCVLYQNSNETLKYETISHCQKKKSMHKLLCFYLLQKFQHLELSYLKTVCKTTQKDLDKYFKGVDFETNEKAKILLGICYLHGFGYDVDLEKAFGIFKELSDKRNSYGQFFVGRCYYYGEVVKKDWDLSFKYMSLSAEQGNILGIRGIGLCYEMGKGVDENYEKAMEMYSFAAKKGCKYSLACIGFLHAKGYGVKMDKCKAFEYYRESVTKGSILAQNYLGSCYEYGFGVGKDRAKAFHIYRHCASLGNPDAQKNLAICYLRGKGVERDEKKAIEYFELSCKQKNPLSQRLLGAFYLKGDLVKQDYKLGISYYELAAEQGDSDANFALGGYYERGLFGLDVDLKKAFMYYQQAKGRNDALFNLGRFHLDGISVEKDVNKAIALFLEASQKQHGNSIDALRKCLIEKELVLETLKRYKSAFQFVSDDLQQDTEIIWMKMSYFKNIRMIEKVQNIRFRFK